MKLKTFIEDMEFITIQRDWSKYSKLDNLLYVFFDGRIRARIDYWKEDKFIYIVPKNICHISFTKKDERRIDSSYWLFIDKKLPVMAKLHMMNGETFIVSKEDGKKLVKIDVKRFWNTSRERLSYIQNGVTVKYIDTLLKTKTVMKSIVAADIMARITKVY